MFNKKNCKNCGKKIDSKYNFCPHCGNPFGRSENQNWGMLGENDFVEETNESDNFPFGGKIIGKMFEGAIKMLEKEMQKDMKEINSRPMSNMQLFINGRRINLNPSEKKVQKKKQENIPKINLPNNNLKKFSELPREEPQTNVRRFSDKIIYEMDMPGVKSEEKISIIPLEQSVEIRAASKNKLYFKILPINIPIKNYSLNKEKLILEFGVVN